MTAKHDRFLSESADSKETTFETYHGYQAAALFNQKLCGPIKPSDRDAILATGALLGGISTSSIEAASPEEAWPLKPSSPSDLQWLKLNDTKKAIWRIAGPPGPESVFHSLVDAYAADLRTSYRTKPGTQGMLSRLRELCDLNERSTAKSNPYYTAVAHLATLLPIECTHWTILRFLSFITDIPPDFLSLIENKDSRALLLLAFWYAKVCHYQWWIARRAMLECKAACIYLEKHHACETGVQELLEFPKTECGLLDLS